MTRNAFLFLAILTLLPLTGCGRAPGIIFPSLADAPRWPGPPDKPRIRYVGVLKCDTDLKPGKTFGELLREAIFGKEPVQFMLTPFAVCTDNVDRLFVADSNAQCVHVFDLRTRKYAQWRPGNAEKRFGQPVGIAYDPGGRLLVADSVAGCIYVFAADGKYAGTLGEGLLKRPCGIAIHATTRRIYVADSAAHQVVVLSANGQELVRIGKRGSADGEFNFPISVAIDRQGRLYVADALNFRVQQISPDMKSVKIIGRKGDAPGYFAQPKCVAVDNEDHLYVIDNQFEAVQMFSPEGQLLMDFGEEGRGRGQFWLPTGMFIDFGNRIWIADSYNRRVEVFDYLSEGMP
ncbi:6-bladed beta-propeller [soil metagenome]